MSARTSAAGRRVEIRAAQPTDKQAVRRVNELAFGDEGPLIVDLLDALDATGRTSTSFVAEVDGAVVGHVQLNDSWLDARERLVHVLVLSPLAVDPGHQRSGLGTALIEAAVAAAETSGVPALFLEGDPAYYSQRGFERASAHGFDRPSLRIPDAAFQVVVFASREDWMTGAVVYCDAFWSLDAVGLRDPLLADIEATLATDG